MSSRQIIHMTEIDATEVDDQCGMKYWNAFMEGGRGMLRKEDVIPSIIDRQIHDDLHIISEMEDLQPTVIQKAIEDILAPLSDHDKEDTAKMEVLYRRLGWLAAFALYVEPRIRASFDTVKTDHELLLGRDPLFIITYPDRILRSKANGELSYREYIPMRPGMNHHLWLESWQYRSRLHIGMSAAETELNVPIAYGQVMGLSRGYYSLKDKKLLHPYVWGWYNPRKQEWTNSYAQQQEDPDGGWVQMPVWRFPGGVVAWVRMCGEAVASTQFPLSGMIKPNHFLIEEWAARRLHREREIKNMTEACYSNTQVRAIYFGKKTEQCTPSIGEECPYLKACWDRGVGAEPFKSGEFVSKKFEQAPKKLVEQCYP